ncbi:hypothetical protein CPJCM30710_26220 [Clostridium polyendosporum]|uniref:DUF1343 domain-containing protein n=1 Tax=Clostridium polyendosporum TaxID=69208 RepID=A0A919VHQ7_9CLOT|nr:DUF1343 domain-containing protein [Clostridium polyendosporum]GIM29956.1 hypothetical protein CPJCM30710_26220 [Clostridium polyendosporum]
MKKKYLYVIILLLIMIIAFLTGYTINLYNRYISLSVTPSTVQEETIAEDATTITDKQDSLPLKLGDDLILAKYSKLIEGKKLGIVTNQTGVNSNGEHIIDTLRSYPNSIVTAIYTPEHGLYGKTPAGEYVKSYIHPKYDIPVYSLYNKTRKPTPDMLKNIDVLIFDIQDVGVRFYTYISTLNYCLISAEENNKKLIVLDRPNPLGGLLIEGPMLEDKFKSFVGIDNIPTIHGMTIGEMAKFFNRKINCTLEIVPMEGYRRDMLWQDTGLNWIQTSPKIPDIESCFLYSATGLGEGITEASMDDNFKWVGGKNVDGETLTNLLNISKLDGVKFQREERNYRDGVRLIITDYSSFNPYKTGIYILSYIKKLTDFKVPTSDESIVMFDKIMGTDMIGQALNKMENPEEIIESYSSELEAFKKERYRYLIYK